MTPEVPQMTPRTAAGKAFAFALERETSDGFVWSDAGTIRAIEDEAARDALVALRGQVGNLMLYDARAVTAADAAKSMRDRALALIDAALAAEPDH